MRILFVLCFLAFSVQAQQVAFMQRAKERTRLIVQKILKHPFLVELAKGTLSGDRFSRFSVQDNIYSWRYADPLMLLSAKTSDPHEILFFMKGAKDSTEEWGGVLPASTPQCPTCQAYSDFELASAQRSFYRGLGAVAPCYVVYKDVAEWLSKNSAHDNPYQKWIREYTAPGFQDSTKKLEEIINKTAAGLSEAQQEEMLIAYEMAVRYEWQYWNSIYHDIKWEPLSDQP